jgi:carbonic anhydrase
MIKTAGDERTTGPPGESRWDTARENLRRDVPASIVVFLVAVPLSLAIALAAGAPMVAGLTSAVVGGVVATVFGGSALQVSGPSAGLTVVLAETITTFGWPVTCAIIVAAGAVQVVFGLSRIARAALGVSPAIVRGLLAGIGVTIVVGQLHVVLGGTAHSSAVDNVLALPSQILGHHDEAVVIGVLTIAILLVWPRLPPLVRRVPGPLAAIVLVTILAVHTGMTLPRVELPADLTAIRFTPRLPDSGWVQAAVIAVTIALIASVESLLSAVAVDRLRDGPRADLNRELVGQGLANMASGSLGGFAVTGVVVRSLANAEAGARTRMSAILHSGWILLFTLALAGFLRDIPLAALAGLLVFVGAKLVNLDHLKEVRRHGDLPVYVVTLVGTVAVDLLTGMALGVVVSLMIMLRRMVWSGIHVELSHTGSRVVIEGALTFLSVPRLARVLGEIPEGGEVTLELLVDYLDHAAFDSLFSWQNAYTRSGGKVIVDEIGHPWFAHGRSGSPTVRRSLVGKVVPRWLAPWSEWQADHADVPPQRSGPATTAMCRGTSEFQRRAAPLMRRTLSKLAHGQEPHALFITCADARIVPSLITTSGPGDLFTVRNIGNLVPSTETAGAEPDSSVGAAIEYAVEVLRVREIVVCGHSACGAMKAMLGDGPALLPNLTSWLRHAAPSLRRRAVGRPFLVDGRRPETEADQLALHNIVQQLDHLREYRVVADAEAKGELRLTGMYFDVGAARVSLFEYANQCFLSANGIHSKV